jgi:uncharacterized repeat protein (TIGR04052 family)
MNQLRFHSGAVLLTAALCVHCGSDDDDTTDGGTPIPVQLDFAVEINGEPFECGASYSDVGDPAREFSVTDARFYVYDVELLDASGDASPLSLEENAFQGDGLALLDFEDGCGPDGTPAVNPALTGTVAPGDYRGVRFTLGVPADRNFIDLAAAPAPLDVTGMFWVWQYGYKFFKVDGATPMEDGGINPFFIHLGSSDCPGDNPQAPPQGACESLNRVTYELDDFEPGATTIVAEIGDTLATTDLAVNTDGTAPGCMSETNDPECQAILPRISVGNARDQVLFSAR